MKPIIGVIGFGLCDAETASQAEEVGSLIAGSDAVLVCGGLGGVMEAACRGAVKNGGETVGIIPSSDINDANPWVTIPVATNMGHARNIIIAHTAQALIALQGGHGTLTEVYISLKLSKPVVCLGQWAQTSGVLIAHTPKEAVEIAFSSID